MRTVKATNNLKSDLRKVIKEWKNLIKAQEHIGKAQTIGVGPIVAPQQVGMIVALLCKKFI